MRRLLTFSLFLLMSLGFSTGGFAAVISLHEQKLSHPGIGSVTVHVPEGYQLEILATDLDHPRMLAFAPNGDLFIGSAHSVYKLRPPYTRAVRFLSLPTYPHSVAFRDDELFIATTPQLLRLPYEPEQQRADPAAMQLVSSLPGGFGHSSRTVRVGPDSALYVSIGISGNCSDQLLADSYPFRNRRGGIFRVDESTPVARLQPFASGLRNPVDFAWHPTTELMYATNNGPDHHGFDLPPEYFSQITAGSFHGMPWYQYDGNRVTRDDCIDSTPPFPADQVKIPVVTFPARSAPLGMTFFPTGTMDHRFSNSAAVALHGSWATQPDGGFSGDRASRRPPAVMLVRFVDGQAVAVIPMITGFQDDSGRRWARPAGVAVGPDGWLYITSDGGSFEGLMRLRASPSHQ